MRCGDQYYFIYDATFASNCIGQYPCLCSDQNFLATAKADVQEQCDLADQQQWAQYFAKVCPDQDIFSTLTTTSSSQATATTGVASLSAAQSTSVVIVSTTLMNPTGVATTTAAGHSSVIASNTLSPSASPTPSSQDTGGLSVGDKAGIASAVIAAAGLVFGIWKYISKRLESYQG